MAVTAEHRNPRIFFLWLLGLCVAGCTAHNGNASRDEPVPGPFVFEHYEVDTGLAQRQTVLAGFLLGGPIADLAVVHIDEHDNRRVRIYAFRDRTWVSTLDETLRPNVVFVDVVTIDGHDRLVTYEPGCLYWFDPDSATERTLVAVTSNFAPPREGDIPHVDITRDVNDDNRHDLVVADVDRFWVFSQMEDGTFAEPVNIGPSTEMTRIYGADGYRYDPWSQSRVHQVDANHDGRSDLVFWNENHFEVHHQDERGLFAPVAETFTTEVAFDSDQLSSLISGDMMGTVLHAVADLNGDDVADLVIFSLEGHPISRKQSTYEIHFGTSTAEGGTGWAPDPDAVLQSDGHIQLGMDRHDVDRDGDVVLMLTTIETTVLESSLWKRLKGFMGDDIWR